MCVQQIYLPSEQVGIVDDELLVVVVGETVAVVRITHVVSASVVFTDVVIIDPVEISVALSFN